MSKFKSRLTSSRFVYITIISIAVTAILFMGNMFSMLELSKTVQSVQSIDSTNIYLASTKMKASKKKRKSKVISKVSSQRNSTVSSRISSRGSSEIRSATNFGIYSDIQNEIEKTNREGNSNLEKNVNANKEENSTENKKENANKIETNSTKKTEKSKKENKKSATKTISISEVRISKTMDLTKRTGLSRNDFIKLISRVKADSSGFFEKNSGKIYDLCEKYNINEIFFCGLISAESGWNIASNHRRTHNYISLMRGGKLIHYDSVNEGLEVAAQKLHYNYLTPGGKFYHGKTLSGVKTCFCPSGTWVNLVYGRMRQIL